MAKKPAKPRKPAKAKKPTKKPKTPLIINNDGRVNEEPIGRLKDPNGNIILVYKDNVADAFLSAVGRVPQPPSLGLGGFLQAAAFDERGFPTAYVYNPAGDELNKAQVEVYKASVEAWNQRAAQVHKAIELMLGK